MKTIRVALGLGLLAGVAMNAQESIRPTFSLGGGFATPVGATGRRLDTGWSIRGGGGLNFNPYVGAMVQLGYDSMGINSTTLSGTGAPDGGMHIFHATLDPIIHVNPKGHADVYVTGGFGLYHRYVEFSQPSVSVVPAFNPFIGFYQAAFNTNQILGSYSVNKPGYNMGAGVAFGSKWHGKFFAEARWHRILMGNDRHTDWVPVTFGFRF